MELSKRLQAVADLVSAGMTVADVGTDHGYIPIYLMETRKSPRVLAMDVNEGPLLRAKEHITEHGLGRSIETRLSNGVQKLQPGDCDCVVIAGMGGALTIKILEEGEEVIRNLKEFVLQPQSELEKVRQYLWKHGYCIIAEDMVLEEGKFYPMMKVINGQPSKLYGAEQVELESHEIKQREVELRYGKLLLEQKHPVLKEYLDKEARTKEQILHNLSMENGLHIQLRMKELQKELEGIKYALQRYYGNH